MKKLFPKAGRKLCTIQKPMTVGRHVEGGCLFFGVWLRAEKNEAGVFFF